MPKYCHRQRILSISIKDGMEQMSMGIRLCTPEEIEEISHIRDEDWSVEK